MTLQNDFTKQKFLLAKTPRFTSSVFFVIVVSTLTWYGWMWTDDSHWD